MRRFHLNASKSSNFIEEKVGQVDIVNIGQIIEHAEVELNRTMAATDYFMTP